LGVSRSGFYARTNRQTSKRATENLIVLKEIQDVYVESRKAYGSPRIHATLQRRGLAWGRNRIARLMKSNGIKALRQYYYRRQTKTDHGRLESENLVNQNFNIREANRVWASDITQFRVGSYWLYLAVVMDLYSRRIVGWSMKTTLRDDLAIDALNMAVQLRLKSPAIHHSDQGSQYSSNAFKSKLMANQIQSSMNQRGSCYDNAVVESFFKTLKAELVRIKKFSTIEEARSKLFEYIEVFYNRQRLHSTLGYKSPVEFESSTTLN
jgi:transposase InsO family protein